MSEVVQSFISKQVLSHDNELVGVYRYSEKLPNTLKEVSFELQPGERAAVVGRTGDHVTCDIDQIAYWEMVQVLASRH